MNKVEKGYRYIAKLFRGRVKGKTPPFPMSAPPVRSGLYETIGWGSITRLYWYSVEDGSWYITYGPHQQIQLRFPELTPERWFWVGLTEEAT